LRDGTRRRLGPLASTLRAIASPLHERDRTPTEADVVRTAAGLRRLEEELNFLPRNAGTPGLTKTNA
jgi:hypothetical protein